MKKLPIGIQSIKKILVKGEYAYVDKTEIIRELIDEGAPHYFMSRPRRFGKSLFLDTLREIFSGNKELFKGCQIYNSDYEWDKHPVVYLDFSKIANQTPSQLETALKVRLGIIAKEYGISIITTDVQVALDTLVVELSNKYGRKVVVLVDEYDKPIIDRLDNLDIAKKNKDLLKGFFGTLKGLDAQLRFTLTTGVSKFSQVSLFSGLNNLTDITMSPEYAGMLGYTEDELKTVFSDHIQEVVKQRGQQGNLVTEEAVIDEIRKWYNGYRFSEKALSVYNPYSTLHYLKTKKAEGYWYSTGTPSFLIEEIKKYPQAIVPLCGTSVLKSTLSDISKIDRIHLAALMFQTGYLTIRGHNPEENSYDLDFPNKEVKDAFFNSLLEEFTEVNPLEVTRVAKEVKKALEDKELESFIDKINAHFAKIPYQIFQHAKEGFYQAVFFTFLEKSGVKTEAEIATNTGRIDLVCETSNSFFVFELKLNRTADIAFKQAEEKKYRERYSLSKKNILALGINFSSKSRNIGDWKGILYSPSGDSVRTYSKNF